MSHLIIEKNLSTNGKQKTVSGAISIAILVLLMMLMLFVKINLPDPPLLNKKAPLELDFGMVQPAEPTKDAGGSGGGSASEAKLGGEPSMGQPNPNPAGGQGQVVTNDVETDATALPPIDPPSSDRTPADNPKIKVDFTKIGKRDGKGGAGDPTGTKNGTGNNPVGTGPGSGGGSGGGNFGGNGSGVGKGRGSGIHKGTLSGHEIQSNISEIPIAEGYGTIVARVTKFCETCAPKLSLNQTSADYSYTGSDGNALKVLNFYFDPSHTSLVPKSSEGTKYPSSGIISITIKRQY